MSKGADSEEMIAFRQELGALMQAVRTKSGKPKRDCAQAMGVSAGVYTAYEEGRRDITLPELEMFAHFCDISVRLFFENTDRLAFDPPAIPPEKLIPLRQRIIGASLRQVRQDKGRTIKDLAQRLGVSARRVADYELGRLPIPLARLQIAAEELNIPVSYFINEGFGPIGEQELLRSQFDRFGELPEELRRFVVNPSNVSYLRVAQRLADLTTEQLRNLAASILDITY
jgi:transcriptional regulator with XRE-family HTH domain